MTIVMLLIAMKTFQRARRLYRAENESTSLSAVNLIAKHAEKSNHVTIEHAGMCAESRGSSIATTAPSSPQSATVASITTPLLAENASPDENSREKPISTDMPDTSSVPLPSVLARVAIEQVRIRESQQYPKFAMFSMFLCWLCALVPAFIVSSKSGLDIECLSTNYFLALGASAIVLLALAVSTVYREMKFQRVKEATQIVSDDDMLWSPKRACLLSFVSILAGIFR